MFVACEEIELSNTRIAVYGEFYNQLEEVAVARNAHDHVQVMVSSIVTRSIKASHPFIKQVGTQLSDQFQTCVEGACTSGQLSTPYTLLLFFGFQVINLEK